MQELLARFNALSAFLRIGNAIREHAQGEPKLCGERRIGLVEL
jgi:hypothetical protein